MERLFIGFLYLYGIVLIIIGALSLFATDLIRRKFYNKLLQIPDIKKYAPLPIAIGIFLLLSAPYNRYVLFVLLLGLLAVIKGIATIVATERAERLKGWWVKANDNAYRLGGTILIILGSVILMGI